jgi:hypothetical protein
MWYAISSSGIALSSGSADINKTISYYSVGLALSYGKAFVITHPGINYKITATDSK